VFFDSFVIAAARHKTLEQLHPPLPPNALRPTHKTAKRRRRDTFSVIKRTAYFVIHSSKKSNLVVNLILKILVGLLLLFLNIATMPKRSLLLFAVSLLWTTTVHGFVSRPSFIMTAVEESARTTTNLNLSEAFDQQPGESDVAFIKRITGQPFDFVPPASNKQLNEESPNEEDQPKTKRGGYQRVEDWDAERKEKGIMSWEERVQFEGQRAGDQVKQDAILRRHLNSGY
jgi:hypothetical protein